MRKQDFSKSIRATTHSSRLGCFHCSINSQRVSISAQGRMATSFEIRLLGGNQVVCVPSTGAVFFVTATTSLLHTINEYMKATSWRLSQMAMSFFLKSKER